jgi:hypothetical protein
LLLTPLTDLSTKKSPGKDKDSLLAQFPFHGQTLPAPQSGAGGQPAAQGEEEEEERKEIVMLKEIQRSKDEMFATLQNEVVVFREGLANLKSSECHDRVAHQTTPLERTQASEVLIQQEWLEITHMRSELDTLISKIREVTAVVPKETGLDQRPSQSSTGSRGEFVPHIDFTDPHFDWALGNDNDNDQDENRETVGEIAADGKGRQGSAPNSFVLTEQQKDQLRQMKFIFHKVDSLDETLLSSLHTITDPTSLHHLLLSALLSEDYPITELALTLLMKLLLSHALLNQHSFLQLVSALFPDFSLLTFLLQIFHPYDPLLRSILCIVSFIVCLEPQPLPSSPSSSFVPPLLIYSHHSDALLRVGIGKVLLTLIADMTLAEDLLQKSISLLTILIQKQTTTATATAGVMVTEELVFEAPMDYERFMAIYLDLIQSNPVSEEGQGGGDVTLGLYLDLLTSLCCCSHGAHLKHFQSSSLVHHKLFEAMTLLPKSLQHFLPRLCRLVNLILSSPLQESRYSSAIPPALDLCLDRCQELLSHESESPRSCCSVENQNDESLQYSLVFLACAARFSERLFHHIPSSRYLKYGLYFRAILSSLDTPLPLLTTALSILEIATVYKEIIILCLESQLAICLHQLYPRHSSSSLETTLRLLHSRITGQDRRYLLAAYHPFRLPPQELQEVLNSLLSHDDSELALHQTITPPKIRPCPPPTPRRSSNLENRFRRISSLPLEGDSTDLASPSTTTTTNTITPNLPPPLLSSIEAAEVIELETKQLAVEILQRSLLREYKKKYRCLVVDSRTKELPPAHQDALLKIIPGCYDVAFLADVIHVCHVTRNETLSLLCLQRISKVSVEKRSLVKKLSGELIRKIEPILEVLLLFQENDLILQEGCAVLLVILTHPSPPSTIPPQPQSPHTILLNETPRFLRLFYSSLQRVHHRPSHSDSSSSSLGSTADSSSATVSASLLCLQILAMGVKFVKIKPPKDPVPHLSVCLTDSLSWHDFGFLIQLLKLYSPQSSHTADRIVESLCQFLCYCIQAHPPAQDLIRTHSGCEVLVTLLSGEATAKQGSSAAAGGGESQGVSTLQSVSHLVTNLMMRNNKNIHFFIAQQNLTRYFHGMERAIRTLNSSVLYGLTSLVCHIYSKTLALYAMYHPEIDLDLTGRDDMTRPLPNLSIPPPSAATKIHIPSHLSKLIDLILDHATDVSSSAPVPRGATHFHALFAHLSDDQMRVLHELLSSTLKLIEFFSTQQILRTSFRSYRAVLVAVTSMTVESRLYCPKITELAKKVAAHLRAC